MNIEGDGEPHFKPAPKVGSGSCADLHDPSAQRLECAAEPTFTAVALLHLKRMAAICVVDGHLIERVNGRFGPTMIGTVFCTRKYLGLELGNYGL